MYQSTMKQRNTGSPLFAYLHFYIDLPILFDCNYRAQAVLLLMSFFKPTREAPTVGKINKANISRREAIKTTGTVATSLAVAAMSMQGVYAYQSNTVQVALIGCGGRGTGAAQNALSTKSGPIKLTAMADVFEDRLKGSYGSIKKAFDKQVDVPVDRQFIGFDGYKNAMDSLKPGDVVILTTPVAFRWVMFAYAIEKGLNVFMEKPTTVDGPGTRRMLELASKSEAKNLKVGVGLMCRHCRARGELHDRIKGGEIGDITGQRLDPGIIQPRPRGLGDVEQQQFAHALERAGRPRDRALLQDAPRQLLAEKARAAGDHHLHAVSILFHS